MAKRKTKSGEEALREAIQMISPGTQLREAISAILQAHTGALICIGRTKRLTDLSQGGVQLDAPCTPQLLYELCKMDGAIILNPDATRILHANRFLKPDASIPTNETGTRHRAAERLAAQAKCAVIAVSERRASVTLYVYDQKHVLDNVTVLMNKASQSLQTLEKYITSLHHALQDLSTREFQDMVTIFDVCRAVQRTEMVVRIGREIDPLILELGVEGRLIGMQLRELLMPVEEAEMVIQDYHREKLKLSPAQIQTKVSEISQQDLLNLGNISQILGYNPNLRQVDTYLSPRGFRILTRTHRLTPQIVENLVSRFGNLQQIIRAPKEDLVEVDGVGEVLAERIRVGLNLLQNQLALDRR